MIYDIIIIGSGISGLYSAYNIKKMYPHSSFLILEKNLYIGGRMNNYDFNGKLVNTGAGIGREGKDKLLIKLLNELNIVYTVYKTNINYSDSINKIDINKICFLLKKIYNNEKKTFKQFTLPIVGLKLYNDLIVNMGYTDYENEDIYEVLYHYGIDDNISGWSSMKILWYELINKLILYLGLKNIKLSCNVESIIKKEDNYYIYTNNNNIYITKKVIIATTIDIVKKLLPTYKIYNQIHGQPFLRMYGLFEKSSIPIISKYVKTTTIVSSPLKKIIPISDNIYMIAYTDNEDAIYFKDKLINNYENRQFYCRLIEKSLDIKESLSLLEIKAFYWNIGTHYYEPLGYQYKSREEFINKAQNPMTNLFVVGEMICRKQGWVEGALESVENILNFI
jgi:hypothetical protein